MFLVVLVVGTHFPRLDSISSQSAPATRQFEQADPGMRSHLTRRKLHSLQATFCGGIMHFLLTRGIEIVDGDLRFGYEPSGCAPSPVGDSLRNSRKPLPARSRPPAFWAFLQLPVSIQPASAYLRANLRPAEPAPGLGSRS
ncbi:hypothetical protein BJX62DRAFT_114036 [Aspergillus germanicus]